jgi:hypothetical protein
MECSGMVYLGDGLYLGLNDSGNPPDLILFTLDHSDDIKRIRITGASNIDWEELSTDNEFVYIGDTGNNSGTRKDLAVYKVRKEEIIAGTSAKAEKIQFVYPEQKKFKPSNSHNYDCEAMICIRDSIYLFSKNRGNGQTDVYSFPNSPGTYKARRLSSYNAGGLVTGADYREINGLGELALVGYTFQDKGYHPFVLYFRNITVPGFFTSASRRYTFEGRLQTETILFDEGRQVLISNEEEHGDKGYLFKVILY